MGFTFLAMGEGMFDGTMKDIIAGFIEAGRLQFTACIGQYLAIIGTGISFFGSIASANKVVK